MKFVILSEAKDLLFVTARKIRSFASLRMTTLKTYLAAKRGM
jgi:hypothetical protein